MYFFLLILTIFFNFISNNVYKCYRFSKTFLNKSFKLIPYEKCSLVTLNPGLILLPIDVNLISEKQDCKENAFVAFSSSGFEIVFALPIKIKTLYMQVSKV